MKRSRTPKAKGGGERTDASNERQAGKKSMKGRWVAQESGIWWIDDQISDTVRYRRYAHLYSGGKLHFFFFFGPAADAETYNQIKRKKE